MARFPMTPGWNLRGAASHDQLELILGGLIEGGSYDTVARELSIPREVVSNVGRWYQSLWLGP